MAHQDFINVSRRDISVTRLKKNRKRELYYSLLVDYFVIAKKTNKGEKALMSDLVNLLLRCTYSFKTKTNIEFCKTTIAEFAWMGMISYEDYKDDSDVFVYALDPLFEAFRTRIFHSNYASLEEARESRILSLVALVVALISLFISIKIGIR